MTIVLPTKKKVVETGWPEQATWLVFGNPKVGKSTFASQWPECLILNMEPRGTRYIEDAYCLDIDSLEMLHGVFSQLKAAFDKGEKPYETVAIDTIDVVKDWIYEAVLKDLGIKTMGDAGRSGADWIAGRTRTLALIARFAQLPVNLLVVAHSRPIQVGEKIIGATVDLPGSLARHTLGAVENILFCTMKGGTRQIIPQARADVDTGSHHPILNKIGSCPMTYQGLRAAFEAKLKKESANEGK